MDSLNLYFLQIEAENWDKLIKNNRISSWIPYFIRFIGGKHRSERSKVWDGQVNYKWDGIKSILKIDGTNLLGGDYRTNIGPGFVGTQYYFSITFDEFLN